MSIFPSSLSLSTTIKLNVRVSFVQLLRENWTLLLFENIINYCNFFVQTRCARFFFATKPVSVLFSTFQFYLPFSFWPWSSFHLLRGKVGSKPLHCGMEVVFSILGIFVTVSALLSDWFKILQKHFYHNAQHACKISLQSDHYITWDISWTIFGSFFWTQRSKYTNFYIIMQPF